MILDRIFICCLLLVAGGARAEDRPWMNTALAPDDRAALLVAAMTPDEQFRLIHGIEAMPWQYPLPDGVVPSAGYIPGIERLGIPALRETDASLGVANPQGLRHGDGATALPSGLAIAATWNADLAYQGGALVGDEAARKGFNVVLGGGVNLTREPRNGRNFEYLGEDPLLAGTLAGAAVRGIQDQHVVATVKHFALNAQETGRHVVNAVIDPAALRESDLLAFELAIETGHPGSVMCAYNRVNGPYACGNTALLNDVLKRDWHYPGWVMSDWGAVPGAEAALAGLDQESGEQEDGQVFFDEPLRQAVAEGRLPQARIAEMDRRILRSMFAAGLFDMRLPDGPADEAAHAETARRIAEQGMVLLRNEGGVLPLPKQGKRILVIGGHADTGVLSGGGSSQVLPPGGPAATIPVGGEDEMSLASTIVYQPGAPLKAIRDEAGAAQVRFLDGRYASRAAAAARNADYVIVFATQWTREGIDVPDLSLPAGQDGLIEAVARANPKTVVVIETGGPVLMPWLERTAAVLEAWYPGRGGAEAIADILFGDADPSGHLPITFPAAEPAEPVAGLDGDLTKPFDVTYAEGAAIGYRGGVKPLFPFGFGLSYTGFGLSFAEAEGGATVAARVTLSNVGERPGRGLAQLYLLAGPNGPAKRLLGWCKLDLQPGQSQTVSLTADPRLLADFDPVADNWRLRPGAYEIGLGSAADDIAERRIVQLDGRVLPP
jgi:beta-glucosidase